VTHVDQLQKRPAAFRDSWHVDVSAGHGGLLMNRKTSDALLSRGHYGRPRGERGEIGTPARFSS
jgi:hypothetical protein